MIDFEVDETGDFILDGQNDLQMVDGDEELCQCVADILSTNLGEWFLNPQGHGFRRFEVLGKKFNKDLVTEELVAAVLQEDRVSSVEEILWEFDRTKRSLSGRFRFTKLDGSVVEGVF
ncbi:uncharacterized protein DUF2634 [Brevibacillus sp. AG162]|uniref:DUF2634 domain-containing protein n=1 Tax=Brevibacillus sp. AG162 TaxID=2572910 RepID=UPI001151129D|nr:DUF2634 domain-containing protein [Brevibacillus sp. AG162]TQK41976.1 uncharacterized protein DUF2634 [Brevibacillus sp. AG162]